MVVRIPDITDEELNNIPKIRNGHTKKFIHRSIMARRETIHSLMAKGYNQYQTAAILHCSQETVCKDVAWLRNYYRQQIHHYIENRLPELWESCLTQLHSTMVSVDKLLSDPETSTHDKIHAHALMLDCIQKKQDLLSDPTVIQEALQIVDQSKRRLIELNPERSREILREQEQEQQQRSSTSTTTINIDSTDAADNNAAAADDVDTAEGEEFDTAVEDIDDKDINDNNKDRGDSSGTAPPSTTTTNKVF
jgi:DNA-binding CsgD family transcriptional regulator